MTALDITSLQIWSTLYSFWPSWNVYEYWITKCGVLHCSSELLYTE